MGKFFAYSYDEKVGFYIFFSFVLFKPSCSVFVIYSAKIVLISTLLSKFDILYNFFTTLQQQHNNKYAKQKALNKTMNGNERKLST